MSRVQRVVVRMVKYGKTGCLSLFTKKHGLSELKQISKLERLFLGTVTTLFQILDIVLNISYKRSTDCFFWSWFFHQTTLILLSVMPLIRKLPLSETM